MRNHDTWIQCALDWVRRLKRRSDKPGHRVAATALAIALAASALGAATPVQAVNPSVPAARLQVIVKKIHISNDRDGGGSGELRLYVQLCPQNGPANVVQPGCENTTGFAARYDFSADSGTDVFPDRALPAVGDFSYGDTSIESGMPVFAGQTYILQTGMLESDSFMFGDGDDLGITLLDLTAENGWQIGEHTQLGSAHSDGAPAGRSDYVITYEIVRTPLPDLHVSGFRVVPGTTRFWCAQVENIGQRKSRQVSMNVLADGTLLRQPILPGLDLGAVTEHCVASSQLAEGPVTLNFIVDEPGRVDEFDETNNFATLKVQGGVAADTGNVTASPEPIREAPAATPTPGHTVPDEKATPTSKPTSNKGRADLTVESIEIGGQTPDGKNACKTKLTVTVKNDGDAAADPFVLRVAVDGSKADPTDKTVTGLGAGQQQTISFEGIYLDPGEHKIKAIADPDHATSESKEGNNVRKVSARCQPERY